MAYATLGQLDARLTEIDDLLVKAELGDVHLQPSERSKLEAEAEAILKLLAEELGKRQNLDPAEVYKLRKGVRDLNHIAAVAERHVELHPNDAEADRTVAEAFQGLKDGTKTKEEAARMIASVIRPSKPVGGTDTKPRSRLAGWFDTVRRILTGKRWGAGPT
jgi:hypothetical protein